MDIAFIIANALAVALPIYFVYYLISRKLQQLEDELYRIENSILTFVDQRALDIEDVCRERK